MKYIKHIKQHLAILLVVLLIMPVVPAAAEEKPEMPISEKLKEETQNPQDDAGSDEASDSKKEAEDKEDVTEKEADEEEKKEAENNKAAEKEDIESNGAENNKIENGKTEEKNENETEDDQVTQDDEIKEEETEPEAVLDAESQKTASEEVCFNTGNRVCNVVSKEDFEEYELGDDHFEEDGSYTIHIPEENPFFPYEVQFTYDGKIKNKWFMTLDDSVTINGHTFYVSAHFDETAVTQMSLSVGGDKVIIYPEKKKFTNDGDGTSMLSLLPLEERNLTVDLTGYTPVELTQISIDSIFTGDNALNSSDKVIWRDESDDEEYTFSTAGDYLDLSYETFDTDKKTFEMLVGDGDQLTKTNVRYKVRVKVTESGDWLEQEVFAQDTNGNRKSLSARNVEYVDYKDFPYFYLTIPYDKDVEETGAVYVGLKINDSIFPSTLYDSIEIYEGIYKSPVDAVASGKKITDQLWQPDMSVKDAGYKIEVDQCGGSKDITLISYGSNHQVSGCLTLMLGVEIEQYGIYCKNLYDQYQSDVSYTVEWSHENNRYEELIEIQDEAFAIDAPYHLILSVGANADPSIVTAAYAGKYASVSEATSAGVNDIKGVLFNSAGLSGGYQADYSKGVTFTIFIDQQRYEYYVETKRGNKGLSNNAAAFFKGLKDASGNEVFCYIADNKDDSYGEYNYLTMLVDDTTDLTRLAPVFNMDNGVKLYADGSSSPEVSGKSIHDFSNGPVQYTTSAENGRGLTNYWLQIVKPSTDDTKLYINSLALEESKTEKTGSTVCSDREVILDCVHDYKHDILIANMGSSDLAGLSVSVSSNVLELDDYWTLSGNNALETFDITKSTGEYATNLAKIRLKKKSGATDTEVSGTVTIKSGGKDIMMLNLNGMVGDPQIVTGTIPQAVKYVPYGTMIQNNNKYSWNQPSYTLLSGKLPQGMVVKENGELYGVPTEAGDFRFTVRMKNSSSQFSSSEKTYMLKVVENTDANVDQATDTGYDLTDKVQDISLSDTNDQLMVSQGVFGEFVDLYLDGQKLTKAADYTAVSGSTRITIKSQTLKASNVAGTHTLGVEFRTSDNTLKRAAQNYTVSGSSSTGGNESGNAGGNTGGNAGGNTGGSTGGNAGGSAGGSTSSGSGSGNVSNSSHTDHNNHSSSDNVNNNTNDIINDNANTGSTDIENNMAAMQGKDSSVMDGALPYTVQAGDTLWLISEKFYGTGGYWEKIYTDNADRITDADKIYAGQIILIYPVTQNVASTEMLETGDIIYTVKPGDTLWKIAQEFYGKGWLWRRIYSANEDTIEDPNDLHEGQVLVIPK